MRRSALVASLVGAAFLNAASAGAATTFGPDLTTGPAGTTLDCGPVTFSAGTGTPISSNCNTVLVSVAGVNKPAPVSGVLVGFSIKMATGVSGHLRILNNPGGDPVSGPLVYDGVGPDVTVPGDSQVHTFPVRLPISAGDLIAFGTPSNLVYRNVAGSNARVLHDTNDGSTPPEAVLDAPTRNLLQAPFTGTIEPDADGDVFGDETQDQCPGTAGANNGCPNRTLTVIRAGTGSGFITSSDSQINCGSACTHSYVQGATVTLTAVAASGSKFSGWAGGGCSGIGTCTVTLGADQAVTATFKKIVIPPPPDTKLLSAQIKSNKKKATFRFGASGVSTGFQCALAKRGRKLRFSRCRSPKTYRRLRKGSYIFKVRAVGPGGVDKRPVKLTFQIS